MGRLVLRRLSATVPVLLLVTAGVFLLLHLTPGDPIDVMMAESVDAGVKQNLRRELGLDRPLYVQYAAWMGRLLKGDLGRSIRNGEPVIGNVSRRLRPSLELAFFAMTISLLVAFPVGIVSAIRRNSGGRPGRCDVRAVRDLHAELPAGAAADLPVRGHAALAADLRLHRSARGAVERVPLARVAGHHARPGPGCGRDTHPALEPARGAGRGLRA